MRNEEITKALEGLWEAQAISELISKGNGTIDKVDRTTYEGRGQNHEEIRRNGRNHKKSCSSGSYSSDGG